MIESESMRKHIGAFIGAVGAALFAFMISGVLFGWLLPAAGSFIDSNTLQSTYSYVDDTVFQNLVVYTAFLSAGGVAIAVFWIVLGLVSEMD